MAEVPPRHLGTFCERKLGQLTQWSFFLSLVETHFYQRAFHDFIRFLHLPLEFVATPLASSSVFFSTHHGFPLLYCVTSLHFIVPGHGQLFGNVPFSHQVKLRSVGSSGGPVLSLNRETLCLPERRRTQPPVPFEKTGGTLIVLLWQPRCVCLSFWRKESVQSCGFRPSSIRPPRVLNLQANRPTL